METTKNKIMNELCLTSTTSRGGGTGGGGDAVRLPSNTYAVAVHKQYADRLLAYLQEESEEDHSTRRGFIQLTASDGETDHSTSSHRRTGDAGGRGLKTNDDNDNSSNGGHCDAHALTAVVDNTQGQRGRDGRKNRIIMDLPETAGVSRARRGFWILLVTAHPCPGSWHTLPPIIRQNISWVGRITHYFNTYFPSSPQQQQEQQQQSTKAVTTSLDQLGETLWQAIQEQGFLTTTTTTTTTASWDAGTGVSDYCCHEETQVQQRQQDQRQHLLRVDCYPRQYTDELCLAMQQAAARGINSHSNTGSSSRTNTTATTLPWPNDPFEGPIGMTMAKSKCTHRVSVVFSPIIVAVEAATATDPCQTDGPTTVLHGDPTTTTTTTCSGSERCCCYWGVESRESHPELFQLVINEAAGHEMMVKPCDHNTGADKDTTPKGTTVTAAEVGEATAAEALVPLGNRFTDEYSDINRYPLRNGGNDTIASCTNMGSSCTTSSARLDLSKIPLSRAYYKLLEVWTHYLEPFLRQLPDHDAVQILRQGSGLDLGASPGGWTQVLVHVIGLLQVVAIDPGPLAERVHLPQGGSFQVLYQRTTIDAADYSAGAPYSMLVCDASMIWAELLDAIRQYVLKPSKLAEATGITSSDYGLCGESRQRKRARTATPQPIAMWCCPAVMVVTLKLPFKTLGSIQRHVDQIHEQLPGRLREFGDLMYGHQHHVEQNNPGPPPPAGSTTVAAASHPTKPSHAKTIHYRVVHLMSNSASERTMIATFQ